MGDDWLEKVANGTVKMSQRKLSAIEANSGIDAVSRAAIKRGLHLICLIDDTGAKLVAASRHPFDVIC